MTFQGHNNRKKAGGYAEYITGGSLSGWLPPKSADTAANTRAYLTARQEAGSWSSTSNRPISAP